MLTATSGNKEGRTSHWDERSRVWEQLMKNRDQNERKREGYGQRCDEDITSKEN